MNAEQLRNDAQIKAREPYIDSVETLLKSAKDSHTKVNDSRITVEWHIPQVFEITVKEVEKTVTEGEKERKVTEEQISCKDIEWLRERLQQQGYVTEIISIPGYFYGKSYYLKIDTQ